MSEPRPSTGPVGHYGYTGPHDVGPVGATGPAFGGSTAILGVDAVHSGATGPAEPGHVEYGTQLPIVSVAPPVHFDAVSLPAAPLDGMNGAALVVTLAGVASMKAAPVAAKRIGRVLRSSGEVIV